jgi:hypothetical protein
MRGVGIGYDCALSKDDAPVAKLKTRPVINWGVTEPGRFARLFSAFSRCLRLDGLRLLRRAHSAGEPAKWDSQAASNGRATTNSTKGIAGALIKLPRHAEDRPDREIVWPFGLSTSGKPPDGRALRLAASATPAAALGVLHLAPASRIARPVRPAVQRRSVRVRRS